MIGNRSVNNQPDSRAGSREWHADSQELRQLELKQEEHDRKPIGQ